MLTEAVAYTGTDADKINKIALQRWISGFKKHLILDCSKDFQRNIQKNHLLEGDLNC